MKVEFGAMEETAIPGFKGGEGVTHARMFADGCNRIMRGRLEPGCSIGLHTHEGSSEIVYVLSGTGKALYGGGEERLAPGTAITARRDTPTPWSTTGHRRWNSLRWCPSTDERNIGQGPADANASAGPCFVCRRAAIPRARRGIPP